jgi:NADH-quinone oxidoreductase subunit L
MSADVGWWILACPLAAFVLIVVLTGLREYLPFLRPVYRGLAAFLTILGVGAAFVLSVGAFLTVWNGGGEPHALNSSFDWIRINAPNGGTAVLQLGIRIDQLSTIMLILATAVSLLVQIYSLGYMSGEIGFPRYYAFMALFTFSMLGLVVADNLLQLFIFWELVGLCSYLLIGHWYDRPAPAAAQLKAFLTTRLGDVSFLLGLMVLWWASGATRTSGGTFNIEELIRLSGEGGGLLSGWTLTIAMLLLFGGAVGKSAQWPLHTWLPDAMEGPTPVSALIHAATMVAAGVYLVARTLPIFEHSAEAMLIVAIIGGFTAIFAATMGLVMNDIKRVLAYSTVSQLGYMFLGLGSFGLVAGIFHLFNHGFFKALLFLGSGSVIHGTGTQDIREMGGLRRVMPWTFLTFLIGSAALAGIPPLSGFFSKDEILADAFARGQPAYLVLFLLGLAAAFMTAFYIFRVIFVAFFGENRGVAAAMAHAPATTASPQTDAAEVADLHGPAIHADDSVAAHGAAPHAADHGGHGGHGAPHESPWVMVLPLIILAVPSILTGFLNFPGHGFAHFLDPHHEAPGLNPLVAGLSIAAAVAGIVASWAVYHRGIVSPQALGRWFRPLYVIFSRKYWVDEVYGVFVRFGVLAAAEVSAFFDRFVVDGAVNGLAWLARQVGGGLRYTETGRAQLYGLTVFVGVLVLFAFMLLSQEPINADFRRLLLR